MNSDDNDTLIPDIGQLAHELLHTGEAVVHRSQVAVVRQEAMAISRRTLLSTKGPARYLQLRLLRFKWRAGNNARSFRVVEMDQPSAGEFVLLEFNEPFLSSRRQIALVPGKSHIPRVGRSHPPKPSEPDMIKYIKELLALIRKDAREVTRKIDGFATYSEGVSEWAAEFKRQSSKR